MKITDPAMLEAIHKDSWDEIQDGLFAVVGQRYLIDVALHIGPTMGSNEELPECVWVAETAEIPELFDGYCNSSETGGNLSIWERACANKERHVFTTQESMMAFFTEFVTTHNHLI